MTKGFFPFLRKEFVESVRTFRFLILALVTVVFGVSAPLLIKYMPEFLGAVLTEEMMGGINILALMPPATAEIGWAEFISSVAQTGVIAAVVLFAGSLSGEVGKNTLIPLLSRGLGRHSVVLAKWISNAALWTVSYAASAALTVGMVALLFPGETVNGLLPALFCLWVYGLFMSGAALLASALCRNIVGGLLVSGGVWMLTMLVSLFPPAERWNPLTLATGGISVLNYANRDEELLSGLTMTPYTLGYLTPALILTAALTLAFAAAAVLVFRRKRV